MGVVKVNGYKCERCEHTWVPRNSLKNPTVCPKCKKHMKSVGTNQGYRCKKCGTKSDKPKIVEKKRELELGFYEVPVCARRHLSKPLKRIM